MPIKIETFCQNAIILSILSLIAPGLDRIMSGSCPPSVLVISGWWTGITGQQMGHILVILLNVSLLCPIIPMKIRVSMLTAGVPSFVLKKISLKQLTIHLLFVLR